MKRGFGRIVTVTAAMVSMLSMSMTVCAAENYTVAQGDHLMKIAQNKYGDQAKWDVIYEANKETIKEPTKIYPGQVIVIPDLAETLAAPAAQPEVTQTLVTTAVVQPETAPAADTAVTPAAPAAETPAAPAVPAAETPVVPAAPAVVQPEAAPAVQTAVTLEEYYKDPEFKKELDAAIGTFDGDGMELSVVFQRNTMAVIIKITDPSYMVEGIGEALSEAMAAVSPMVEELVAMIENELGNPGDCVIIYSYQAADGTTIAQRAFTAK